MTSQTRVGNSDGDLEETSVITSDGEARAPVLDDPGRKLGRYVLISELGRGGMGVVYAAYDPQLDRRVAVKLIHASGNSGEERLRREAKALGQLTHPNVVTVYEVGDHDGRVFIAMEYVQGQTLKRWLRAEPRSDRDKLEVLLGAAEGLGAAHQMGLVHRDFKPDNVMVGDDGRVRVMDFGLVVMSGTPSEDAVAMSSGSASGDQADLTVTGTVMGTPRYMAPEQFVSKPTTPATDQFSFCTTALEAFAGTHPIGGDSYQEIFGRVRKGYRDADALKQVPKWIRDVLARGLEVDPDDRWPSMGDLQSQLRKDPRRRRRALGALGVAAAAGLALFGSAQAQRRMEANACAERADEVPSAWGASTRGQTEEALSAVPHLGPATAQRVLPKLDAFAATWRDVSNDVCLDPAWADAQLNRQAGRCLDDAKRRFEGLVRSLSSEPDVAVVRAAVRATSDLPDPLRCRDRAWLARQPELPLDRIEEVEAIESLLSSASSAASVLRYEVAQQDAEAARELAEALEWAPLMARVDLKLGEIHARKGNPADAQRYTQRGRTLALASGDIDAAIRGAAAELRMLGDLDRLDDAVNLRDSFNPIVERFAEPGTRSNLEWTLMRGELAVARSEFDEAESLFGAAQKAAAEVLGEKHPQHARVWLLLASLAERRDVSSESEQRIARALEIGQEVFGPDHPTVMAMLNVSAMVQFDKGDVDEGLRILQRIVETSTRVLGPEHPDSLDYVSNLATREAIAGRLDQARPRMEFVLEVERRRAPRGSGVASALTNLGTLCIDQGRGEEGVKLLEEALELHVETAGPRTFPVANTAMNLGGFLSGRGEYEQAAPHLRKAQRLFEDLIGPDARYVAHIAADLAKIEARTSGPGKAQASLERARRLFVPHVGEDSTGVAELDGFLAVSLAQQGRLEAARTQIDAVASKLDSDDTSPRARAEFLINRSRVRALSGDAAGASEDLGRARSIAATLTDSLPAVAEDLRQRIERLVGPKLAGSRDATGSASNP